MYLTICCAQMAQRVIKKCPSKFINNTNKLNIYISFVSILYLSYSSMNYTEFISIALFCIEIVQIK